MSYVAPLPQPLLHSHALAALLFALLVVSVPAAHAQSAWKPDKPVEIVVYASAGGGGDQMARIMQKIWQETKLVNSFVTNKVGGGGAIAYTYTSQKAGDGHVIAIAQGGLIGNDILGRSSLHFDDLTPLAFVVSEPVALAVRTDSPYKTLKDFMGQLKKDPSSLAITVGSQLGASNHFTIARLGKAADIDLKRLKIVVFGGGGEVMENWTIFVGPSGSLQVTALRLIDFSSSPLKQFS